MMTALHSNGVQAVIIEKLDRLARDLMVQEATIADAAKQGFTLISVAEPDLMVKDPQRVFYRRSWRGCPNWTRATLSAKLRGARMRSGPRKATARPQALRFYPGEPEVITRMHALRASGMGL